MHRSQGTHVSFVRSLLMDTLSETQLMQLERGGNDNFKTHLSFHGVMRNGKDVNYLLKPAAQLYKVCNGRFAKDLCVTHKISL